MSWRWLLLDFIPPEFELTRAQRQEVRSHVINCRGAVWRIIICCGACELACVTVVLAFVTAINNGFRSPAAVLAMSAIVGFGPWIVFCTSMFLLYRPVVLRALDLYLQDRCGSCGYDFRGLDDTTDACPECGHPRHPSRSELRHSTCRACGYNLTGLPDESTRCPECGAKRI